MKICPKCKCASIGLGDTFDESEICITCREDPDYGTPLHLSQRLSMMAAAQRAQVETEDGSILCLAPGCRNKAREWWYVCSRECRDRLVEAMR